MEDLTKHLIAQERSNKSISEYCQQHGIPRKRFYDFRARQAKTRSFVEVAAPGSSGNFELRIRDGISVVVPARFNEEQLKQLLQVLGC